jgi:hypothetical protein
MNVSKFHIAWLIAASAILLVLGLLFVIAPSATLERIGVETSDRLAGMIRVAGSVLLAEAAIIAVAVRSREPIEIRLVTLLVVIHFTIETLVRIVSLAIGESDNPIAAIPQAVVAIGLALQLRTMRHQNDISRSVSA